MKSAERGLPSNAHIVRDLRIVGRMFRALLALEADGAPQVGHHKPEMLHAARARLQQDPLEAARNLQIKLYVSVEDVRRVLIEHFKEPSKVPEEFELLLTGGWADSK